MTDYGFTRVSAGSQDAQTQERDILRFSPGAIIVRPETKAASASKGEQLDALDAVIAQLRPGDRVIVTDSSRLDRRDNLTSQVRTMLAIRETGAEIVSLAPGEDNFGSGDDLGSWVTTLVKQNANAEKSKTVKTQTFRGVSQICENRAHHGPLPKFWETEGERYRKQAYCADPGKVADIYERVAKRESLSSIGRIYDMYPKGIKHLIRFSPNHTGVEECSYTDDIHGKLEWTHTVTPVVDSPLWWRANKVLDANLTDARGNKGGRPVAKPANWISGILDCPSCGGKLYVNDSLTPAGNPRTPKLRCSGTGKRRLSCGEFKGIDAQPVIDRISRIFTSATKTKILAFQRVTGNAHELEELKAGLRKIQARLSATEDDDALDALVAERKQVKARIDGFEIVPDTFDYAPTGQTVAERWNDGDDAEKRRFARAIKNAWGMILAERGGEWVITFMADKSAETRGAGDIVDLGDGLCFPRPAE
ncbi:MAG: recombinase family protein [Nocardiopsaceae bacterium]|nr:recombinase family protein [Nocardiopsaceae bacterium]